MARNSGPTWAHTFCRWQLPALLLLALVLGSCDAVTGEVTSSQPPPIPNRTNPVSAPSPGLVPPSSTSIVGSPLLAVTSGSFTRPLTPASLAIMATQPVSRAVFPPWPSATTTAPPRPPLLTVLQSAAITTVSNKPTVVGAPDLAQTIPLQPPKPTTTTVTTTTLPMLITAPSSVQRNVPVLSVPSPITTILATIVRPPVPITTLLPSLTAEPPPATITTARPPALITTTHLPGPAINVPPPSLTSTVQPFAPITTARPAVPITTVHTAVSIHASQSSITLPTTGASLLPSKPITGSVNGTTVDHTSTISRPTNTTAIAQPTNTSTHSMVTATNLQTSQVFLTTTLSTTIFTRPLNTTSVSRPITTSVGIFPDTSTGVAKPTVIVPPIAGNETNGTTHQPLKPKLLVGALLNGLTPKQPRLHGYEAARYLLFPKLKNVELEMRVLDDTNAMDQVIMTVQNLQMEGAVAIVGPTLSANSELAQVVASAVGLTQVSCCSTSSRLSAKERYPTFTRVITEDSTVFALVAQAVAKYGWTHVGVFNTDDPFGVDGADAFTNEAIDHNIKVEFTYQLLFQGRKKAMGQARIAQAIQIAKSTGVHIFVACMITDDARMLLEQAYEAGLVGPGYVWIGTNGWADSNLFTDWAPAKKDPYAFQGILSAMAACNPKARAFASLVTYLQQTGNLTSVSSINAFTCFAFDSVGYMAQALDHTVGLLGDINTQYKTSITAACLETQYFKTHQNECQLPEAYVAQIVDTAGCKQEPCKICGLCEFMDSQGGKFSRSPQVIVLEHLYTLSYDGATGSVDLNSVGDRTPSSTTYAFFGSMIQTKSPSRNVRAVPATPGLSFALLGYVDPTNTSTYDFINRTVFAGAPGVTDNTTIPSDGFDPVTVPVIEEQSEISAGAIAGIVIGSLLLIGVCVLVGLVLWIRKRPKSKEKTIEEAVKKIQKYHVWTEAHTDAAREALTKVKAKCDFIPFNEIAILDKLGSGAFGDVFRGVLFVEGFAVVCAIKSLRKTDQASKAEFLREAKILKLLDHPNIVHTFGLCTDDATDPETGESPIYLLLEFMDMGNLQHYVKKNAGSVPIACKLWFAEQTASALAYLAGQKIIHRDIAARNVLLGTPRDGSNGYPVAKLSDMGLARLAKSSEYVKTTRDGLLPVRWMAPESIWESKYTEASDVYSYGIMVWEVFSDGALPFEILDSAKQIAQAITTYGMRPPKPERCPEELYELLLLCWDKDPENRPPFVFIEEHVKLFFDEYNSGQGGSAPNRVILRKVSTSGVDDRTYLDMVDRNAGEEEPLVLQDMHRDKIVCSPMAVPGDDEETTYDEYHGDSNVDLLTAAPAATVAIPLVALSTSRNTAPKFTSNRTPTSGGSGSHRPRQGMETMAEALAAFRANQNPDGSSERLNVISNGSLHSGGSDKPSTLEDLTLAEIYDPNRSAPITRPNPNSSTGSSIHASSLGSEGSVERRGVPLVENHVPNTPLAPSIASASRLDVVLEMSNEHIDPEKGANVNNQSSASVTLTRANEPIESTNSNPNMEIIAPEVDQVALRGVSGDEGAATEPEQSHQDEHVPDLGNDLPKTDGDLPNKAKPAPINPVLDSLMAYLEPFMEPEKSYDDLDTILGWPGGFGKPNLDMLDPYKDSLTPYLAKAEGSADSDSLGGGTPTSSFESLPLSMPDEDTWQTNDTWETHDIQIIDIAQTPKAEPEPPKVVTWDDDFFNMTMQELDGIL